jgi:hypothetical protein
LEVYALSVRTGAIELLYSDTVSLITAEPNDVIFITFSCERFDAWSFMAAFDAETMTLSFAPRAFSCDNNKPAATGNSWIKNTPSE